MLRLLMRCRRMPQPSHLSKAILCIPPAKQMRRCQMISNRPLPKPFKAGGSKMQHVSPRSVGLRLAVAVIAFLAVGAGFAGQAMAQDAASSLVSNMAGFGAGLPALISSDGADGSTSYSLSLQILALMTAMTVLPSLVLGMTSFTRIIIVLSILRQAMGTQQTPPNQVLIAIALFLTFFIMSPTLTVVYETSAEPYLNGKISAETALNSATNDMKKFMVKNTRKHDLNMFLDLANNGAVEAPEDVPLAVLLPAFI